VLFRSIELAPPPAGPVQGGGPGGVFPYGPGQFAFVRFRSQDVSGEEHHFTLASTPTRSGSVIFTPRCAGDFTATIPRLAPGDTAALDGPYGLFSYPAWASPIQPLVFIAGGIGVTPIISMLRHLADRGDQRSLHLVWSNRSEQDLVLRSELAQLGQTLPNLRADLVMTCQPDWPGPRGRLDADLLTALLKGASRHSEVFVCGPPGMMDTVVAAMKTLGFPGRGIHTERFSL
jgi:predicted ferric reductase